MFPSQWRKLWEMTKQFMSAFETFFSCLRYHKGYQMVMTLKRRISDTKGKAKMQLRATNSICF